MAGDREGGQGSLWRRPGFLVAGAFIVLVGLLAVFVLFSGNGGSSSPHRAAVPAPTKTRVLGTGCEPADTDQQVPVSAPAGIGWSLYGPVAVPVSASAGPLVVSGGVARCYAHTPVGALIASWQISARLLLAPDWGAVITGQVVPGPGRDAYTAARAKTSATGATDLAQLVAFRFVTYTPLTAVIEEVTRATSGQLQVYTLTVTWDGDWKLDLQDTGAPSPQPQNVPSLDGFIAWGGV